MSIEIVEKLRALASEALRVVAQHDAAPPLWRDTGRWQGLPCRGCGQRCDPSRRWCASCSAVLP